jgi:hypothetical protein
MYVLLNVHLYFLIDIWSDNKNDRRRPWCIGMLGTTQINYYWN